MKVPAMTLKESVKHVCTCGEGIKGFATQNVTSPASPPPKKKRHQTQVLWSPLKFCLRVQVQMLPAHLAVL